MGFTDDFWFCFGAGCVVGLGFTAVLRFLNFRVGSFLLVFVLLVLGLDLGLALMFFFVLVVFFLLVLFVDVDFVDVDFVDVALTGFLPCVFDGFFAVAQNKQWIYGIIIPKMKRNK